MEWWYQKGKKAKEGPVSEEELKRRFAAGDIARDTLVWREGLEDWQPLEKIDELEAVSNSSPPPLPGEKKPEPAPDIPLPAGHWRRFFARILDLNLFTIITLPVLLLAFFAIGYYFPGSAEAIQDIETIVSLVLGLFVALTLDAVCGAVFGNTPGKALLRVTVQPLEGRFTFFDRWQRNMGLWASGLALGLPLLNLFAMAYQSGRLRKGERASYDDFRPYNVTYLPTGPGRILAFILVFLVVMSMVLTINVLLTEYEREAAKDIARHEQTAHGQQLASNKPWENPITGETAQLPGSWTRARQSAEEGAEPLWTFTSPGQNAMVLMGYESYDDALQLPDYVFALTSVNELFDYQEAGFSSGDPTVWTSEVTRPINGQDAFYKIYVYQRGKSFWRIITIDTKARPESVKPPEYIAVALKRTFD